MTQKSKTVLFFGSGPVAAHSLELLAKHTPIEAVVTKPSTYDEMAAVTDAPTYAVSNKSELDTLIRAQNFHSELGIVIDFGIIISRAVIDAFPKGIINSHFSLLPGLRGADPISFAILSGQEKTGVSIMLIDEKMDEGPLLAVGEYELPAGITTPALTNGLINLSDSLLRKTLPKYLAGEISSSPQSEVARTIGYSTEPSYTRKLTKVDGVLDWHKPAKQLEREIRAFLDWPKSRTKLGDVDVVITASEVADIQGLQPGQIHIKDKEIIVGCGNNTALSLTMLKPAGKKEMPASSFLAGYKSRILR